MQAAATPRRFPAPSLPRERREIPKSQISRCFRSGLERRRARNYFAARPAHFFQRFLS
jgi:hypothetical protein